MLRVALLMVAVLVIVGCRTSIEPTTATPTSGPSEMVDMGRSDGGIEQDADQCEPVVICAPDVCGRVDDGCGGTLECDACLCDQGQPVAVSCGRCGLGTVVCNDDVGDVGTCDTSRVPDLPADDEACAAAVLYVDADARPADEFGSREAPFVSLQRAVAAAEMSQARVIIIGGSLTYEVPIEVAASVHIVGGFGPSPGFAPDVTQRPKLVTAPEAIEPALTLRGLQAPTTIGNLDIIRRALAPGTSGVAIGIQIQDSVGVVLRDVRTTVEPATEAGLDGSDGSAGVDGRDGEAGRDGLARDQAIDGGAGGINVGCRSADGGEGGQGGAFSPMAMPGRAGEASAAGAGGGAASPGGVPGANGEPGSSVVDHAGTRASDGAGGTPATVIDGEWRVGVATPGVAGQPGAGGGGGGGGFLSAPAGPFRYAGPSGGGGGSGGCGGQEGTSGGPGFGSIALFVTDSGEVEVIGGRYEAGDATRGGRGGTGGLGGQGGRGGNASAIWCVSSGVDCFTDFMRRSGPGGSGSDGQTGGHGGGGTGGSSIGVFCHNSAVTLGVDTGIVFGEAGQGGDSQGNPGADGQAAPTLGCE